MSGTSVLRTLIAASESAPVAVILKATLVLLLTLAVLRVTRRVSASLRHRLAAATFGVLLLLPIVASLAPSATVMVPAAAAVVEADPRVGAAGPAAHAGEPPAPHRSNRTTASAINPVPIVLSVYFAGVAFFLISLMGGVWRLYRMRDRAEVSVAGTRMAKEIAQVEGISTPIEVMISEELAVPMTFGTTVLLPAESREWDDVEIRRAVRHELEHIQRGDWLTQVMSRLACAFYWPHPLVWSLWQRLRLEAERACDDAVLRSDAAPDAYAEQLVSLARRLVGRGQVPALAMATRSSLGRRVEAILDGGLRRGRLGRAGSFGVAIVAVACLVGLAPLRVMSAPLLSDPVHEDMAMSERDADPLDVALFKVAAIGDTESAKRLIDRGARANSAIRGDGSPLIAAASGGHVDMIELLIRAGADVNRGVRGDGNPLTLAAQAGHLEAVRLLLDRGADIDRGVQGDGNALIMAAGAGQLEVVRYLLDRGASIEQVIPGDENALIHACEGGQAEVVKYLIERGANVNARVWAEFGDGTHTRGEWRTPLSMATRNGHQDVVAILRAAKAAD